MRSLTGIILHCSATRPEWMAGAPTADKVEEIRRWHVRDRGWSDIGYHYLIDRDGTVAKGRSMKRDGAHVIGHNRGTIGVCLIGGHGASATDTFGQHFTPDQADALRRLLQQIYTSHGKLPISGHNDYTSGKGCPGFQVGEWLRVSPVSKPSKPAKKESLVARILRALFSLLHRKP